MFKYIPRNQFRGILGDFKPLVRLVLSLYSAVVSVMYIINKS